MYTKLCTNGNSIATTFVISRRRMVVPIYKKWEATLTRIQIVKQEKVVQLLAFFNDFNHGRCMNFLLKGTDTMESFMRSGRFWVRYVDAKFALPKTEDDPSSDFLCLDMPEYPIEHDDISIAFDSETGKTRIPPGYLVSDTNGRRSVEFPGSGTWVGSGAVQDRFSPAVIPWACTVNNDNVLIMNRCLAADHVQPLSSPTCRDVHTSSFFNH